MKPLTNAHLYAFNKKHNTAPALILRAEYCEFMAETNPSPAAAKLWLLSAARRRAEAKNVA